jgi:hypothetical protein
MRKTKVDGEMEALAERVANDPERKNALETARRFKASWLELAGVLVNVKRGGSWKRWGYDTFEAYAKAELKLRQETIDKLTGSYQFLEKRAPAVLSRDAMDAKMPSYQTIDFLRKAEERGEANDADLTALYTKVIDQGASLPQVRREFAERAFPVDDGTREARDKAAIRNVAGRLRELLREVNVLPDDVRERTTAALDELLAIVAAAATEDAA